MKTYEFEGRKYEETGEVKRLPQYNEIFLNAYGAMERASINFTNVKYPILRLVEEKFKVGDRVRCMSKNDGSRHRGQIGTVTQITGKDNNMIYAQYDDGENTWMLSEEYELDSPAPRTIGSTTHRKLKSLSPIGVVAAYGVSSCSAVKLNLEAYVSRFGLFTEPQLPEVIDWCNKVPKRLEWAIKEGYIEEVKKNYCPTCGKER